MINFKFNKFNKYIFPIKLEKFNSIKCFYLFLLIINNSILSFNYQKIETDKNILITHLISAIIKDDLEKVKLILKNDYLNINVYDGIGTTALNSAVVNNKKDIVKLLLNQSQINVNQVDKYTNDSPLHLCLISLCNSNSIEIMRLLLDNNDIDVNIINNNGYTPLDYAALFFYFDCSNINSLNLFKLLIIFSLIKFDKDLIIIDFNEQYKIYKRIIKVFNIPKFSLESFINDNIPGFNNNILSVIELINCNLKNLNLLNNDQLEIFLIILSFNKFFRFIINANNYKIIEDFFNQKLEYIKYKKNNHNKDNSLSKILLESIKVKIENLKNEIFMSNLFRINKFTDIDINFN